MTKKVRLGDLLVAEGFVKEEQIDLAFKAQKEIGGGKKLGEILIEKGFVEEDDMLKCLCKQLNFKFYPYGTAEMQSSVADKIQLNVVKRVNAIPIREDELFVEVLFADPLDFDAQDAVQRLIPQKPIKISVSTRAEIRKIIEQLEISSGVKVLIADIQNEIEGGGVGVADGGDSAVFRLLKNILQTSIARGASDIHIEPGEEECKVRSRIDGFLQDIFTFPANIYPPLASNIKLTANLDIAERRKPQDGRFSLDVDGKEFDFRLSTLPISHGESIVMRILDKSKVLVRLDDMGLSKHNTHHFRQAMKAPYGIVFVTGPTGSGKTTTLYAALNEIKNVSHKLITVEDPIEYQISLIQQVQVNERSGLSFAAALRSILRQDPDIIMVGEARDKETLSIGIQAALTGHLVFTTLHTNDALSAVTRIMDMGIAPFLIANAIVAVQAQRLVRKICEHCKGPAKVHPKMLQDVMPFLPPNLPKEHLKFFNGKGCKKCQMSGYSGRTMVSEILTFNDHLAAAVIAEEPREKLYEIAVKTGFQTMFKDGLLKVLQGKTTLEEVLRVSKGGH